MENGRTLFLNGTIADESWYDDDVTPQLFKNDLYNGSGDVTVWLNSPGGDCVAAAQIYNMLKEYPGNITSTRAYAFFTAKVGFGLDSKDQQAFCTA